LDHHPDTLPRMTDIRVMFIGHGPSGLPADDIVNTFHFTGGGPDASLNVLEALNAVEDFYLGFAATPELFPGGAGSAPVQTFPLGAWLSPWIQRSCELRGYNLADLKPRVPLVKPITLPAAVSTEGLVEEVALCLSYRGQPPVTPRRRGRLYLGPLGTGTATWALNTTASQPAAAFVADICRAALRLSRTPAPAPEWSILSSRPAINFVKIVNGYVDNAFDVQTRRGPDATSRVEFDLLDGTA
jgi:hypothetical protein